MGRDHGSGSPTQQDQLYETAIRDFGRALDRLAAGYEGDPDKRNDLRQEIHFQLWRSLQLFDGRCSLKTWTFRVAHNTAVSHIQKERRKSATFVGLAEIERNVAGSHIEPDVDQHRALERLSRLIHNLKPLDRLIMISYLEEIDNLTIAEITGLSPANVGMKIHRIKNILARAFSGRKGPWSAASK